MSDDRTRDVTRVLRKMVDTNPEAEEALVGLVYEEFRDIAGALMRTERPDHTLQPTAVVNEAFLRLRPQLAKVENRRYLFAAARRAMRQVLIDHARARRAQKRSRGPEAELQPRVSEAFDPWQLEFSEALDELEKIDPRKREIVEYRFFVGLTVEQVAAQLGLSVSQIEKDWRAARAWLYRRLGDAP